MIQFFDNFKFSLGGWRFPIKYEEREKFCRGVTARSCQTLVVVESKAISEPQNGHLGETIIGHSLFNLRYRKVGPMIFMDQRCCEPSGSGWWTNS